MKSLSLTGIGRRSLVILILLLICISCAHVDKIKDAKSPAGGPGEIPSPVSVSVEQEKKIEIIKQKELYSFSLREADVKDVLRAIARQTNYNMVIEPNVEGECTVDLKDVTFEKALEYILEPLEFSYKIEGKTVYVSKPKLETKMFPINYLALKKTGNSTLDGSIGGGGTSSTSGGAGSSASGSFVKLESKTDADIWKSLEENTKKLLSPEGNVFVNSQANMVVVTDYPKHIKTVAKYLEGIEAVVHRQVMIEARVVEVVLDDGYSEGINWQLLNGKLWDYTVNVGQQLRSAGSIVLPTAAGAAAGLTATTPPLFAFFVGSTTLDINNTFVELLKTQGTVNIVSSPRIATLNNQRAVIKVTRQDVYFDVQQSTGTSGGGGGGGNTVTYTPKFINIGLMMDVIPQIDDAGNIILNIHPMLTNKVGQVAQPINTGTGPTTYTYVPVLDVRETDTMVKVKDGDTVIIGGLLQDHKDTKVSGIPGLMSIPLLGKLFSYTTEVSQKIELVILLTPRVVYSGDRK